MTDKPKSFRYMWLLPLAMLGFAILACDDIAFPPPMVDRVEAQPDTAGQAYARVINVGYSYDSADAAKAEKVVYETDDYGLNWHRSEHVFAESAHNTYTMVMSSETLQMKGRSIWTFPRSIFRRIFYDDTTQDATNQFVLPYSNVSNSAAGDTLYIAMGTQGVLVGKLDENGIAPDWHLSAKGMDTLMPLPMTITDPGVILGIVLLILFVPPFALVHAYLLQRVWVYLLPAAEARQMALRVTAGLVVLAIIGSIFWLTNERTDLYQVIGVLTVITVIVGVTATVLLAQKAGVTTYTRNRLAGAAFFVSLIVPGGVAAIFAMWWLVFALVCSYWAYQRVYWRYIQQAEPTPESRLQRWQIDRLVIEMILVIGVGTALTIVIGEMLWTLTYRLTGRGDLIHLVDFIVIIAGLYFLIQHYSSRRAKAIFVQSPDFQGRRQLDFVSHDLWVHTA